MNDKRRIFIAINLPDNIKREILDWQEKNPHLNVRWAKEDSLHITMAFIGYINDDTLRKTINIMTRISAFFRPFEITLEKIAPGPSLINPRMIWIEMTPNKTLRRLNSWVDNALVKNHIPYEDTHAFHPHITIARSNNFELRGKKISADLNMQFTAESIDVMESRLYKIGAEYKMVEKLRFGG